MKEHIKALNLSPLRYPGSKKRLVPYLCEIIRINKLSPSLLVEPFVGGGSIMLHLLYNRIIEKVIIADKDKMVYSFWKVLFSRSNYLLTFIKKVNINLDNFYKFKNIAQNDNLYSEEQLAEACIFLNRTSFSGILTNEVGPLGGAKQQSKYKLSCRFNKLALTEKIKLISQFSDKVTILHSGWRETINFSEDLVKKKGNRFRILFYLDPPFFEKAKNLYRLYFDKPEHEALSKRLLSLKHNWLLSYDNVPEIKKMYACTKKTVHLEMPYSINSHAKRLEQELIITSLDIPSKKLINSFGQNVKD